MRAVCATCSSNDHKPSCTQLHPKSEHPASCSSPHAAPSNQPLACHLCHVCQQPSTSIRPYGERACQACTHLRITIAVPPTPKVCSKSNRSDASHFCHHCCHCVVAVCTNAAPKECIALQPFERFEPDQNSALQHTRGQCPLIVGIRVRGRVARGASLRGAFAHFCGKANV